MVSVAIPVNFYILVPISVLMTGTETETKTNRAHLYNMLCTESTTFVPGTFSIINSCVDITVDVSSSVKINFCRELSNLSSELITITMTVFEF